ncbi:MAG: hypothetical protein IIW54_13065 [Lachnospiraceae bacterium]|nr:hypothetical protein [Lachnospiraceae bacterium]
MLKRGVIKLNIKDVHPKGYAGLKPHGNNEIFIYTSATKTPQVAAGYTAHEAKHYLQKLSASTYRKIHEFEAYSYQAKVDKSFPLRTSEEIWEFINNQPAYRHLRD